MKKSLLTVLLCVCFGSSLVAQRVNLDEFPIDVSFVRLPRVPLPAEFTTYTTSFTALGYRPEQIGFTTEALHSTYFTISGLKKVDADGHVAIQVQLDLPIVGPAKEVATTTTSKDKEGKETRKTTYTYSFSYYVPVRYTLTDYQRNVLEEGAMPGSVQARTHTTSAFDTQAQLSTYWKTNSTAVIQERCREHLSQSLSSFQFRLNTDFGYVVRTKERKNLWILNTAKHPEYDAYQQHYQLIKGVFDRMTAATGADREALRPALTYLTELPARYPTDDKADRKLRYSAFFNLAVLYYWLDDMPKAIEYADLLIKNDYDKRDGEAIKESANATQSLLTANRTTTRHFVRDAATFGPPALPAAILAEREAEKAAATEQKRVEQATRFEAGRQLLTEMVETIDKIGQLRRKEISRLDSVLAAQPTNHKLYRERAEHKRALGDWRGATDDLTKAASLKPTDAAYANELAWATLNSSNSEQALAACDKAIALSPKNADLYHYKGVAFRNRQEYEQAIVQFDKAIALGPKRTDSHIERGFAHDYLWHYDAALADFIKAAQLDPKSGEARFTVGFGKMEKGQFAAALPDFNEAIRLSAFNPRAYGNRAYALGSLGRFEEANADIAKALQQDKNYANGYFIRAWLRLQQKEYTGAVEDARKAELLNHSKLYRVYTILGDALLATGATQDALNAYTIALKNRADYADALRGMQKAREIAAK